MPGETSCWRDEATPGRHSCNPCSHASDNSHINSRESRYSPAWPSPKKPTLARSLRLHRQRRTASEDEAMPPDNTSRYQLRNASLRSKISSSLTPAQDLDRLALLLGCNELLDGLARASMWLADGTFKSGPKCLLPAVHHTFPVR